MFWDGVKHEGGYSILHGRFRIDYLEIGPVCIFVLMNSNNS